MKKQELLTLIQDELAKFNKLKNEPYIVQNAIPIVWFGDYEKYFESKQKIITASLNPSDIEFKQNKSDSPSTKLRFPDYDDSIESLYTAYNNYFLKNPYNAWFKGSFGAVLESFDASFYTGGGNIALHTDIGCPYPTNPTWSGLSKQQKANLETIGIQSWHNLVTILEPDIILFSASRGYEKKIQFSQIQDWISININSKSPLLKGIFEISPGKKTIVLFQVQGRKPFLQSKKEEKLKFSQYI